MDCTIVISNYESLPFLKACIRQVRKYKHPWIEQHIIISDQSCDESHNKVKRIFGKDEDITLVRMNQICLGYAIDYIIRLIPLYTKYICTLDVDAFPIHPNWLYVPIKLLEEENLSFIGGHCQVEWAYKQMGDFFVMNGFYRVGRTEDYVKLSLNAGFIRFTDRNKTNGFEYKDDSWNGGWSDTCVTAHWWEDKNTNDNKLTFAVKECLGVAPIEGKYGVIVDDLIFHLYFSYNWKFVGEKEKALGKDYLYWVGKIDETDFSEELIDEMLSKVIPLEPPIPREYWDGTRKVILKLSGELNNKIDYYKLDKCI